ncbi:MAG TPA: hypothetical protein PKY81_07705 [bacterium]|nr:hypothetical protein [bacterium]HPN30827.1 hypothetical protein [bacterium]
MINKLIFFAALFFCGVIFIFQNNAFLQEYNKDDYDEIISYFLNPHLANNSFSGWAKNILEKDNNSIDFMLNHLDTVNSRTLYEIRSLLVKIGKPSVKFLAEYISDTSAIGNIIAVEALGDIAGEANGDIGDTSAINKLGDFLNSAHPSLKNITALSLGKIVFTNSDIIERLMTLTSDTSNMVKKSAILSLGKLAKYNPKNDTEVFNLLYPFLSDTFYFLRFSALEAIQKLDTGIVVPKIINKLDADLTQDELKKVLKIISAFSLSEPENISKIKKIFYSAADEYLCSISYNILNKSAYSDKEKLFEYHLKKFNRKPAFD